MKEQSVEQHREQLRNSPEWKAVEGIDVQKLKDQLEKEGFIWYLVEASIDFIENGKMEIFDSLHWYKDKPESHRDILSVAAEGHIKDFTPTSWVEPIRVPTHGPPQRLCDLLADIILEAIQTGKNNLT